MVQAYGSTTEFAVPSLNTMAPHDGVGMTWESGYFVGPASPLISNVIVDAAVLGRFGRPVRTRLLHRLDEEVGRAGNRRPLRSVIAVPGLTR